MIVFQPHHGRDRTRGGIVTARIRGLRSLFAWALILGVLPLDPSAFASGNPRAIAAATPRKWSIVPDVVPQDSNIHMGGLDGLAVISKRDAWGVGYYEDQTTFVTYPAAEHWDGESWSYVPTPTSWDDYSGFYDVAAFSSRDVWAVGSYYPGGGDQRARTLAEHWNGSSWAQVATPTLDARANLFGVDGVSPHDLWAVGNRQHLGAGERGHTLIEHWDGKVWKIVPSPNYKPKTYHNILFALAPVTADDVWAVGDAEAVGADMEQAVIEHWNGKAWSLVSAPLPRGWSRLRSIVAISASDIWAVGSRNPTPPWPEYTLVEHWDGTRWRIVPAVDPGNQIDGFSGVEAISAKEVWAVGDYWDTSLRGAHTLVERWNGKEWKLVASPSHVPHTNGGSALGTVKAIPGGGGLWAVGSFNDDNAPSNALIERYGVPFCSDGVDNDRDGATDYPDDRGCTSKADGSEMGTKQCDDQLDNDGDGKIDYRVDGTGDPECTSPSDDDELLPVPPMPLPSGSPRSHNNR